MADTTSSTASTNASAPSATTTPTPASAAGERIASATPATATSATGTPAPSPAPAPVTTGQGITPAGGQSVTPAASQAVTGQPIQGTLVTNAVPPGPGRQLTTLAYVGDEKSEVLYLPSGQVVRDPGLMFQVKTFDKVDAEQVAALDLDDIRERFIHRTSDAAVIDLIPLLVARLRGQTATK